MKEIILNDLPTNHILRNTPLSKIGAMYRYEGSKVWHSIDVLGGIKKTVTYNDLGDVWKLHDKWKVDDEND
jgi:hypothetical protein